MMKPCANLLVVVLLAAWPSLASAAPNNVVFQADLRCDLNGDNLWNQDGDNPSTGNATVVGKGFVRMFSNGRLKVNMSNGGGAGSLPGNTQFSCNFTCAGNTSGLHDGALESPFAGLRVFPGKTAVNCGTTTPAGDALFLNTEFRVPRGDEICLGPVFEMWETAKGASAAESYNEPLTPGRGAVCKNGFGTGGGAL